MNNKIGVVTVLYNCEGVLEEFFQTLNSQVYKNLELIVVDNLSKDNSLSVSKTLAKQVTFPTYFIENNSNLGVAAGNNQGIKLALEHGCDYVLLSNNDIVLQPDTIKTLLEEHIKYNADLSVPKIYYADVNKLWMAGGYFNKTRFTGMHTGINEEDKGQYDSVKKITYAPTCFMLINSEVFESVGLMDEKYFVYFDDTDFVYRCVYLNNKTLYYIPASTLKHKVSYSTGEESDFSIKYLNRNWIYFARKFNKKFYLFYIECILFHLTVRNLKLRYNRHKWSLMLHSFMDGFNY